MPGLVDDDPQPRFRREAATCSRRSLLPARQSRVSTLGKSQWLLGRPISTTSPTHTTNRITMFLLHRRPRSVRQMMSRFLDVGGLGPFVVISGYSLRWCLKSRWCRPGSDWPPLNREACRRRVRRAAYVQSAYIVHPQWANREVDGPSPSSAGIWSSALGLVACHGGRTEPVRTATSMCRRRAAEDDWSCFTFSLR